MRRGIFKTIMYFMFLQTKCFASVRLERKFYATFDSFFSLNKITPAQARDGTRDHIDSKQLSIQTVRFGCDFNYQVSWLLEQFYIWSYANKMIYEYSCNIIRQGDRH